MVQELNLDPRDEKKLAEEEFEELTEEHDWVDTDIMSGDDGPIEEGEDG